MSITDKAWLAIEGNEIRKAEAQTAQIALPSLLSGDATWFALKREIDRLVSSVPQDHDVLILVGDVTVLEAEFIEPHK